MMATAFLYDNQFLNHQTGSFHPESPERLYSILGGLKSAGLWDQLKHITLRAATEEQICLVHTRSHYEYIRDCSLNGDVRIDVDTVVSAGSFDAAVLAAGAAIQGVSGIMNGEYDNAFAASRPPGHHATADQAMGFCLFNNIAIAARYLVQNFELEHVLIMDWDVHHGNGTQAIFWDDPSVIYISLHKAHHYPGTGWEDETGGGRARGTKINVPVGTSITAELYEKLFERTLEKAAKFKPEFILVSCGFDAHERDLLGNLRLKNETYATLTKLLFDFSAQFKHQRIFSILEGGYDFEALAAASVRHVGVLMEHGK